MTTTTLTILVIIVVCVALVAFNRYHNKSHHYNTERMSLPVPSRTSSPSSQRR